MSNGTNLETFEAQMIKHRLARNTISTYLSVAKSYIAFCRGRSFETPQIAVSEFLSTFPATGKSATYQKQALNALAGKNGLYHSLGKPLGKLPSWVKAKRPKFVPEWVTKSDLEALVTHLPESWGLIAQIMFGAGLRISEVVSLRWRDLDFERLTITVKQSKGQKDRVTFLPSSVVDSLRDRFQMTRRLWKADRSRGRPGVEVPNAIANKSPKAGETWPFFWVFPAAGDSTCPVSKIRRRHHLHPKSSGKAIRKACHAAGISKRITAHSFRHGFATSYLLSGGNLRELMELMGHKDISTTEVYLHCLPSFTDRVGSPLDAPKTSPGVIPFPVEPPLPKIATL